LFEGERCVREGEVEGWGQPDAEGCEVIVGLGFRGVVFFDE